MSIFRKPRKASVLLVAIALLAATAGAVQALDLTDLLKVGGIGYAVTQFAGPIDEFINKALGEREAQAKGATKVVPILSLGGGGYIGAAQVLGVPSQVERTKFVVQVESKLIGSLSGTLLVPVGSKPTGGQPDRIKGVGVSAVVEFKL